MAERALPIAGRPPRAPTSGPAPGAGAPTRWVVGGACNLGCDGCRRAELAPGPMPERGAVLVAGGEPTLAPAWLGPVRASGRPWELETNGTLLYVPANVARLRAAGARRVRLF